MVSCHLLMMKPLNQLGLFILGFSAAVIALFRFKSWAKRKQVPAAVDQHAKRRKTQETGLSPYFSNLLTHIQVPDLCRLIEAYEQSFEDRVAFRLIHATITGHLHTLPWPLPSAALQKQYRQTHWTNLTITQTSKVIGDWAFCFTYKKTYVPSFALHFIMDELHCELFVRNSSEGQKVYLHTTHASDE